MKTSFFKRLWYLPRLAAVVGIILGVTLVSMGWWVDVAAAPPPPLPPFPTPEAAPTPTHAPLTSAYIRLHVHFPQAWPWNAVHWQELYTVVQWQDGEGEWHDVQGWRGGLDTVIVRATPTECIVGEKTWWFTVENFDAGRFRWQVYQGLEGPLLVTSAPFHLLDTPYTSRNIDVFLDSLTAMPR